jgi:hypothetical protein
VPKVPKGGERGLLALLAPRRLAHLKKSHALLNFTAPLNHSLYLPPAYIKNVHLINKILIITLGSSMIYV